MDVPGIDPLAAAALASERRFVLALGGYALEVPGGTLVIHEKIPSPRFNYVVVERVAPQRQAAFFERALDHYFQRAIRPRFRCFGAPAEHVARALHRFSFRPLPEPRTVLVAGARPPAAPDPRYAVGPASDREIDQVVGFWTVESERPELRTSVDVAMHHPSPDESLVPVLAKDGSMPVAAALLFRSGEAAGIHLVTTRSDARGQGAASALVQAVRADGTFPPGTQWSIVADTPRLVGRLTALGFSPAAAFTEYELPRDAELALPPPGPPTPARWRPPR